MKNVLIGIEWEPQITLLEYPNLPVDFRSGYSESNLIPFIKIVEDKKVTRVLVRESVFRNYSIGQFPHNHFFLSTDQVKHNLELRTYPVSPSNLPEQIDFCNSYLSVFITQLKQYTSKGIGVFFPKADFNVFGGISYLNIQDHYEFLECHTPSKHVSISFQDELNNGSVCCKRLNHIEGLARLLSESKEYNSLNHFRSFIKTRLSTVDYNSRIHITVPYNFTAYKKLIPLAKKLWRSDVSNWLDNYLALAQYIDRWYGNNEPSGPKLISYIKNGEYITTGGLL